MKNEDLSALLATRIQEHHARQPPNRRTLVALAGGPGSGKSTIAAGISDAVSQRGLKCQAVSIEGFIKPSHALTAEQQQRKGSIDTFDGEAVVAFFEKLRELGRGHEVKCPGCNEEGCFEPIPDAESVHADAEVVIFEGIYLLADREPWKKLEPLVDEKWFIHVRPDLVRRRVAERRLQKGKAGSMEESLKSYDEGDAKNNDFIAECRYETDLVIESNEELAIRWPDGRVES
ncbi:hypothetical protein WHR41_06560 [Cladosporium halotolerans]|uniref:Phosphoribulokinase/uridine kinase domain-containing protein n=1 Tax=Cladosporium halotolerans TaxID=1052096 RepID=A0AB34KLE6_9PEZI